MEMDRVGGRYEIIAPIGSGGVGTVYKAIDRESDETIAIKVLFRGYDISKKRRKIVSMKTYTKSQGRQYYSSAQAKAVLNGE